MGICIGTRDCGTDRLAIRKVGAGSSSYRSTHYPDNQVER